jgi:hypothetical protein
VGLVIVLAQFLIDRYKTIRKVSATIEGPFAFAQIHELFDKAKISFRFQWEGKTVPSPEPPKPPRPRAPASPSGFGLTMEVKVDDLQVYKATIRNTGNSPVKDLPIRFVFENASDKFRIFAAKHKTNPEREFGEIKDDFSELSSPRFIYQLLNPGDEDVITILATEKRDLKVYSKGEGVAFEVTSAGENRPVNWFIYLTLTALGGIILGIITTFLSRFFGVDLRA